VIQEWMRSAVTLEAYTGERWRNNLIVYAIMSGYQKGGRLDKRRAGELKASVGLRSPRVVIQELMWVSTWNQEHREGG
jgi:hypothetical protein